ncbi:flippase-like domain-containing protein [Geomonas nitrogeniifigens]|uniref:Flippase-like domain-containing protein n=1 Tax=Geomonas diazotrophica TaxID=2843197 RepID=A0ABX8JUB6_9BACT|nr:lysylphosphatidylglycerol synthase transmembrane domain-containing protein [Geomonas nitrogeniifigens]QWV99015.1 flippase-like domain-containing protein [Geomonas nitrogeniifigens]QXE88181.1 flippase-like domain-containing protein [Geomonas nitrogeniifigens]
MFTGKLDKKLLLGLAISALCLFFLFRKIDFHKMAEAFAGLEYAYLVPALLLTFVSYYLRAVRWKFLLLPIKKTGMGNLFTSTLIGYMANNLLPARLGELVRAYSLGNKEGIGTSAVFASLVLERLCDGFTVLLVLLVTFFTIKLPAGMEGIQRGLVTGGYVTFALYLAVLTFLFLLRRHTEFTLGLIARLLRPVAPRLGEKMEAVLCSFISGIRLPGDVRGVVGILVSSLLVWFTAIWPVDLMLRAFGVFLPATASMFIMVFLVFAVMVPASPGFIGTYHLACVTALSAFQIGSERALSIAIVLHAMGFFPVTVAGLCCLWRDKLSIRNVENTSQEQLREQ